MIAGLILVGSRNQRPRDPLHCFCFCVGFSRFSLQGCYFKLLCLSRCAVLNAGQVVHETFAA